MNRKKNEISVTEKNIREGIKMVRSHPLFGGLYGTIHLRGKELLGKDSAAKVDCNGNIFLNFNILLQPRQWAHIIAHCYLHLAFGHFDVKRMPGYMPPKDDNNSNRKLNIDIGIWNLACDIYIAKFLQDMKFGEGITTIDASTIKCDLADEKKIYQQLRLQGTPSDKHIFGTASIHSMDMIGLERTITCDKEAEKSNIYMQAFARTLARAVSVAVWKSGGYETHLNWYKSTAERAREWFISKYPLLGGVASGLKIVEDSDFCKRNEISIAAINTDKGEIYINPSACLSSEEMKFVIAHELLHAGLSHQDRCQGRNPYLWNIACDYVINGWLTELEIGEMLEGALYDEAYQGWNAEGIYDEVILNIRKNSSLQTLRGYGKGDIIETNGSIGKKIEGVSIDEFCKNALSQGLEYHKVKCRGLVPAGLVEEIRALSMPSINWNVQLAKWFNENFSALERRYTYSRPSRRQSSTPDIPRPRYVKNLSDKANRTFGVIIDTSGSMSSRMLGMALGSIASYAAVKEVRMVRIVFCDARAYDAGYLAAEEIASRVEVKGRGGTKLQTGIDLIEKAKDFPQDGPILIITDGAVEKALNIHRKHAFLLPRGSYLPFKAKGEVFYFGD